jgi:hypothetical protein
MEQLLTAANSISQRSIHDLFTTPHDRYAAFGVSISMPREKKCRVEESRRCFLAVLIRALGMFS